MMFLLKNKLIVFFSSIFQSIRYLICACWGRIDDKLDMCPIWYTYLLLWIRKTVHNFDEFKLTYIFKLAKWSRRKLWTDFFKEKRDDEEKTFFFPHHLQTCRLMFFLLLLEWQILVFWTGPSPIHWSTGCSLSD